MGPTVTTALLLISALVVESLVGQTEDEEAPVAFPEGNVRRSHDNTRTVHILQDGAFPGSCRACKYAVGKVKKMLGKDTSREKIERLLDRACNGIKVKLVRKACASIVKRYRDRVIDAIADSGDPKDVCVKVKLCKAYSGHLWRAGASKWV